MNDLVYELQYILLSFYSHGTVKSLNFNLQFQINREDIRSGNASRVNQANTGQSRLIIGDPEHIDWIFDIFPVPKINSDWSFQK